MKIKLSRLTVITAILAILPAIMGAVLYSRLPAMAVTHWDFYGEPNGWSPKWVLCFGIPAFMAVVSLIVNLSMDNTSSLKGTSRTVAAIGRWVAPVLSLVLVPMMLYYSLGAADMDVAKIICTLLGVLFIVTGNYLPKCRRNSLVGIRLPWTLSSDENWDRTHRLSGYVWMLCGLLMLAGCWSGANWLIVAALSVAMAVPIAYSFVLHRRGL